MQSCKQSPLASIWGGRGGANHCERLFVFLSSPPPLFLLSSSPRLPPSIDPVHPTSGAFWGPPLLLWLPTSIDPVHPTSPSGGLYCYGTPTAPTRTNRPPPRHTGATSAFASVFASGKPLRSRLRSRPQHRRQMRPKLGCRQ